MSMFVQPVSMLEYSVYENLTINYDFGGTKNVNRQQLMVILHIATAGYYNIAQFYIHLTNYELIIVHNLTVFILTGLN